MRHWLKLRCSIYCAKLFFFLFRSPWTRTFAGPCHSSPFGFLLCVHTHHTFHLLPPLPPLPSLYPAAPALFPLFLGGPAYGLVSYWASSSSAYCCSSPWREVRRFGSPLLKQEDPWIPFEGHVHLGCLWWSWQTPESHSGVRECIVSRMRISWAPARTEAPLTALQGPLTSPKRMTLLHKKKMSS